MNDDTMNQELLLPPGTFRVTAGLPTTRQAAIGCCELADVANLLGPEVG